MPSCCFGPQPDRPPDAPHASDEEFDAALSGWTVIDSGASGWAYDVDTTVRSCLYIETPDVGAHTPGLYKATPSLPFRVTAKIAGYASALAPSTRADVGLFLGAATPGNFIHGCLDVAEDDYMCIVGSKWTSPTVWSVNIGDFLNGGSGAGSRSRAPAFSYMRPHWTRFDVHSSTNVDGYVSWDGLVFMQWLSAYNPGFTVGSVGIDIHTDGSDAAVAIDSLRFEDL